MKKYILILCIILNFSYLSLSQVPPDTVKGGFSRCIVFEYKYLHDTLDLNSEIKSIEILFDKNGKVFEQIYYNSDGSIKSKLFSKFDNKGNIVKTYCPILSDKNKETVVCQYDDFGNLIELIGYNSDGIKVKRYTFTYDKYGNLIEEIHSDSKNNPEISYKYIYSN